MDADGAVDHKTESGINPATHASDKLFKETLDNFIPMLLVFITAVNEFSKTSA